MKSKNSMNGKVAIVTGASSGIGLACAVEFASKGVTVVLASRSIYKLALIEEGLIEKGYNVLAVKTDVSREEDCKNLIDTTLGKFGRIDYLVNNAGVSMRALLSDLDIKVIRHLMEANFFGTVYCTKYALPHIVKSKGSIVGVTSIAGFFGLPARSGYSASKFAVQGFLETVRVENINNGLHVMIAAPGFTATNIRRAALMADGTPQGISPRDEDKMMTATEVARKIVKGVIHRRRTIIMSTEGYLSICARRIMPNLLDRILYYYMGKEPNSYFVKKVENPTVYKNLQNKTGEEDFLAK